ncbi:hypothetical protein J6590_013887 [Homalodisca vitripennis]|nr:hypothetical protein J6590_013887 [Homalodisca vitripennis]
MGSVMTRELLPLLSTILGRLAYIFLAILSNSNVITTLKLAKLDCKLVITENWPISPVSMGSPPAEKASSVDRDT